MVILLPIGIYDIGEEVVPRQYKKIAISSEGDIKEEQFTVCGRKIPLGDIRNKLLKKHQDLGLIRASTEQSYEQLQPEQLQKQLMDVGEFVFGMSVQEMRDRIKQLHRQRHLLLWHDASTLLNHGYMLFTITAIYDPAFYYTPSEMEHMGRGCVNVPDLVEKPEIYILGRSKADEGEI